MVSVEEVNKFIDVVKTISTYDFTDYSDRSFRRRIDKILSDNRMTIDELISKVSKDKDFLERAVKDITVNTTELFRDPELWIALKYRILPQFRKNKSIFIWHAGCSSGQEIYSMLILLFELYLDNLAKVIQENPYNYEDVKDVSYEKYFEIDKSQDAIRMKKFLRDKTVFRKHDLVNDKNIFYSKFDIIFCRNVIIYFNNNLQNRVLELFSNNLYRDGYLVLGAHESILGPVSNNFERTKGVYKKKSY